MKKRAWRKTGKEKEEDKDGKVRQRGGLSKGLDDDVYLAFSLI